MSSTSTQVVISKRMGIYEPFQQVSMWGDNFKVENSLNSGPSSIFMVNPSTENKSEYIPHESSGPSGDDQETNKDVSKVLRRLAQNREAARKSRLRKKAYVQQLETSRLKLMQLELEIEKAKKQGMFMSSALDASYIGSSGTVNPGIASFEMEYGLWVEQQHRQNAELRNAMQSQVSDVQLHLLVESGLNHYSNLFRMKADAAKADVFYLISGVWKASVERLHLWIGGSRPSQLLNIIVPQLDPLSDQQLASFNKLRLSSQQAEDALSQGLEKLQQSLVLNIAADPLDIGNFGFHMAAAMEKIEALEGFVNQADHLRQQTLQHMSRILTTQQAAQGLLAMGEYFHRLRALSSLWAARPSSDPAFQT
ncbi:transcription factor TGA7-like [Senna tora]|uniref:Transcription factor TGA7-like n=1 Tax=Senna tora TaxID=362788 RepID=A0A834T8A8_9FABA|nr:transcription factor TGA7-like [Senna tora]